MNIGNYVHLSAGCYLSCAGGITISDYCGLAAKVTIYSSSDDYTGEYLTNPLVPQQFRDDSSEPVILEEHCIIGTGTSILPGSKIGHGSSVGAMSLVTRKLDEWGVYFGSPAKRIKNRKKTILDYPVHGKKALEQAVFSVVETTVRNMDVIQRVNIPEISLQANLKLDLGLDSLSLAELSVRLENEFGVDVYEGNTWRLSPT